jgi:hypothetical protein
MAAAQASPEQLRDRVAALLGTDPQASEALTAARP